MTDSNAESEASEKLHAGTISGAYGIKGWVRVHALTDPLENFLAFPEWFVAASKQGEGRRENIREGHRGTPAYDPIRFESGRRHGKGLIVKVEGVDDRTAAEQLRGTKVWVDAEDLAPLDPGDFYWHQLVGLEVWSSLASRNGVESQGEGDGGEEPSSPTRAASQLLGVVDHLLETGANDVLVIAPCEGSIDQRERLIPYLPDDVVQRVDTQAGRIDVQWHPDD